MSLNLKLVLLLLGGIAIGWFAHTPASVQAASSSVSYQLQGSGPGQVLSTYNEAEQTIYIYQGVGAGYSNVYCSYKLHLGHPGQPVQRENCPVGTLH
jgi:hypothetical protein